MMMNLRKPRGFLPTEEGLKKLQAKQDEKGYTLQDIVDKAGLDKQNYPLASINQVKNLFNPHWRNRGSKVGREAIIQIARVLDLEPTDFVDPAEWNWSPPSVEASLEEGKKQEREGVSKYEQDEKGAVDDLGASPIYVEPAHEAFCFEEICKPSALLRIQGPWQSGKRELMSRVIDHAKQQGYLTAVLNLRDAEERDLSNLDTFWQWLCSNIIQKLDLSTTQKQKLTNKLHNHWFQTIGNSIFKAETYLKTYLLSSNSVLVLALDKLERLYLYPKIAESLLGRLKSWYDEAKISGSIWSNFRPIVLYIETYKELDINQSPFNCGAEIKLKDFSQEQVLDLARQYRLDWDSIQVKQLMALVGGHPYLVTRALQIVSQKEMTLETVLESAPTISGIYRSHLEYYWQILSKRNNIASVFREVVLSDIPLELNLKMSNDDAFELNELGLVKLENDTAMPRYELYRQYFHHRF